MKHSKKRNAGLMYEFLVRTISRALIDDDKRKSGVTLKIIKKYFKPGTEIYKEFRLINSLVKTTVSSPSVAASIIAEAKSAARAHDVVALDREKSLLIKSINHNLQDDAFYDQQINDYRMYATIQSLMNEWRHKDVNSTDFRKLAQYEDQLSQWLVLEKKALESEPDNAESPGTTRLIMKVMTKKLNEKYSSVLNDSQRDLIKSYAFAAANDDPSIVQKKLVEVRKVLIDEIENYERNNPKSTFILQKLNEARDQLQSESLEQVNDELMTRFMLYLRLHNELGSEE